MHSDLWPAPCTESRFVRLGSDVLNSILVWPILFTTFAGTRFWSGKRCVWDNYANSRKISRFPGLIHPDITGKQCFHGLTPLCLKRYKLKTHNVCLDYIPPRTCQEIQEKKAFSGKIEAFPVLSWDLPWLLEKWAKGRCRLFAEEWMNGLISGGVQNIRSDAFWAARAAFDVVRESLYVPLSEWLKTPRNASRSHTLFMGGGEILPKQGIPQPDSFCFI